MRKRTNNPAASAPAEGQAETPASDTAAAENAAFDPETGAASPSVNGDAAAPPAGARKAGRPRKPRQTSGKGRPRGRGAGRGDTAVIVESLLRTRGGNGATPEDLHLVVAWAQSTRAEGEAIQAESTRRRAPRGGKATARAKTAAAKQRQAQEEQLQERAVRHEMNRALLEGVLAGTVSLDVQDGKLVFLHGQAQTAGPPQVGLAEDMDAQAISPS